VGGLQAAVEEDGAPLRFSLPPGGRS
jgi:hypothetical protein